MGPSRRPARAPRLVAVGSLALASTLLVLHVLAVRTETVNWDEFALLARARATYQTGKVEGGGRPGLGTLALIPAVADCTDAVSAVRRARYLWVAITALFVAGFWALLRRTCRRCALPDVSAAVGTGLLVMVPVFLRWSLQVRVDQAALAAGVWAGFFVLDPRRRQREALLAGFLFGVGYLFTQKAVYVGLLIGCLALADVLLDRAWSARREIGRAVSGAVGAALAAGVYRVVLGRLFGLPAPTTVQGAMGAFPYYRKTIGFHAYYGMLPSLTPHVILFALLAWATWRARARRDRAGLLTLALAWGVAGLGLAVGLFHAAAFPYFWMTLGIFPATSLALGLDGVLELLETTRDRYVLVGLTAVTLAVIGLRASVLLLEDSQASQRAALAFVDRNFEPADRGFHPESALFCRSDPEPFPTYFSQHIQSDFFGPKAARNTAAFLDEFRKRPVKFMVASFRLFQFPPQIQEFFRLHYVAYRDNVFVPGRALEGPGGAEIRFDVVAAGPFRWWSNEEGSGNCVSIDGKPAGPDGAWRIEAGEHVARFSCAARGWLTLALRDPPGVGAYPPFYGEAMALENSGLQWYRR